MVVVSASRAVNLGLNLTFPLGFGQVVVVYALRAEDPGFDSSVRRGDFFPGLVIPAGVIGPALELVGPVSAFCDWVR